MSVFPDQFNLWVINVLVHTTVLIALLLLIALLFRRRAAMRYWILCCGLLLVLGSPAISALIQSRGNSWLVLAVPVDAVKVEIAATAPIVNQDKLISSRDERSATLRPTMSLDSELESRNANARLVEFSDRAAESDSVDLSIAVSELTAEPITKSSRLMQWLGSGVAFAVLIWTVGAVVLLLRMLVGWLRLSRILKRADPIEDPGFQAAFTRACAAVGCDARRAPRLIASDDVSGPMAAGIFGGSVVLPKRLIARTDPIALADVLIHEVAHVVRRDQVVVLVQNLVSALYWPHPLVRKLNRELAIAREEVCDNFVLASTNAPLYSRTLLALAQLVQRPETMPGSVGFFASRWKLEQRVAGLLDETRDRTTFLSRRGLLFIGSTGLLLATAVCLGTITLATESLAENVTDKDNLFAGTVFDPDGKPISAQVWIAGPPRSAGWKSSPIPVQWSKVTTSDQLGRFQVPKSILDQFPKVETLAPLMVRVAVTSPEYGFAWEDVEIDKPNSDLVLRLVQDVAVHGKLVSTEGNPIAGVEISIVEVTQPDQLPNSETLIENNVFSSGVYTNWPMWMSGPPESKTVVTDVEGTFVLRGIGAERYLRLQARGNSIADTRLHIAIRRPPADLESGLIGARTGRAESNYFSEFTHIAIPGRTLTGQVTDAKSQSPIADVRVVAPTAWHSRMEPIFTDESGRFQIDGIPNDQQYTLELTSEGQPGYFSKEVVVTNNTSATNLVANVSLTKGKVLSGRIVDAETGQGLAATIEYNALYPNSNVDEMGNERVANPLAVTRTSDGGAFEIAVLSGLGAIGVRTEDRSYARVFLDPSEVEQHFLGIVMEAKPKATGRYSNFPTANGGNSRGLMGVSDLNAFKLLNVDPSASIEPINLAIGRGVKRNGEIFDSTGNPLDGVEVIGLGPSQVSNTDAPLPTNKFSVLGLNPAENRTLVFIDRKRSLGASVVVKGSEQALIRVTLRPTGTIVGKFVDSLGKPIRKLDVEELGLSELGIMGTGFWIPEYQKDGTFKCDGLIEGVAYDLRARAPAKPYSMPVLSGFKATPGQVTDIGTFQVADDGGFKLIASEVTNRPTTSRDDE